MVLVYETPSVSGNCLGVMMLSFITIDGDFMYIIFLYDGETYIHDPMVIKWNIIFLYHYFAYINFFARLESLVITLLSVKNPNPRAMIPTKSHRALVLLKMGIPYLWPSRIACLSHLYYL